MPTEEVEFELRVSPSGRLLGCWSVGRPRSSLSLVVLPKPWEVAQPHLRWDSTAHQTLVVSERETTLIRGPATAIRPLHERLREGQQAAGGLYEVGGVRPALEDQRGASASPNDPDGCIEAFFGLVSRSRILDDRESGTLEARGITPIGPMLRHRFVTEVERAWRKLAPSYREVSENGMVVRGRILPESLMLRRAAGSSSVSCRFDELSTDIELYQGLVTALESVAREPPRPPFDLFARQLGVGERAARLRRALSTVRSSTLSGAIEALDPARLPPTHDAWRVPARLGRAVLRREALRRSSQDSTTAISSMLIPSDRLWERLLLTSLETDPSTVRVYDGNSASGAARFSVRPPWKGLGRARRPDVFVERRSGAWLCLDAKYKVGSSEPAHGDLDQMFLYSHHAQIRGAETSPVEDFVLVYPGRERATAQGPFIRGDGALGARLWIVKVPFPAKRDLSSSTRWHSAMREISSGIGLADPRRSRLMDPRQH